MPVHLCRMSVLALVAGGVAGCFYYSAGDFSLLAPGPTDLSVLQLDMDECTQLDAELEYHRHVVLRRIESKQWVARDLHAGRLQLNEAATRFRAIDRALPVVWGTPPTVGGPGDDEQLCRQVIGWAHGRNSENSSAEPVLDARLKAELEQLRGPDGIVRLPE